MATVVQRTDPTAGFGRNLGEGLAEGLQDRERRYQTHADEQAIQKALSNLGPNASARDVLNAITGTKTYSPESKQTALKNYVGAANFDLLQQKYNDVRTAKQEEQKLEREQADAIIDALPAPEEQKAKLRGKLSLKSAEGMLKESIKGNAKLTPFQKKLEEKYADEYVKISGELEKFQTTLDNIGYARELSKELGVIGMGTSALGLSQKGKELEGVGFALIEPVIKLFNPTGPIAERKLRAVQEKYAVKPTDTPATREGKLSALERFAKQGIARLQERKALIEKYNGVLPEEVIKKFDKDSESLTDAMLDYEVAGEEAKVDGLPEAKEFAGKTIKSPDGQRYYSDGTRWVKR